MKKSLEKIREVDTIIKTILATAPVDFLMLLPDPSLTILRTKLRN